MAILNLVRSTGTSQGDLILSGVYGRHCAATATEPERFKPAPEFSEVSYLFGLVDRGLVPVAAQSIAAMEVPDGTESLVKAQLLFALAGRWSQLYRRQIPAQEGLIGSMLKEEGDRVAAGCRQVLRSQGMKMFLVPVTVTGNCRTHGSYAADKDQLVRQAITPGNIREAVTFDHTRPILDCGHDALSGHVEQITGVIETATARPPETRSIVGRLLGMVLPTRESAAAPAASPINTSASSGTAPEAWSEFQGIDFTATAQVAVIAPSSEAAKTAMRVLLDHVAPLQLQITQTPVALNVLEVTRVRDMQLEHLAPDSNAEGSDDYDDDSDDSAYSDHP